MELLDVLRIRKSTRAFSPKPVSREDLEKIISAGIQAPAKGNSQLWEFVCVSGRQKQAMDTMMLNLVRTDLIPAMTLTDSDQREKSDAVKRVEKRSNQNKEEITRILEASGHAFRTFMIEGTFTFFSAPVAVLVWIDAAFAKDLPHILSVGAAVQNMLLAATDMGLGTCWIGGVWRYEKKIIELLGLPQGKRLFSSVAVGYPEAEDPLNAYKSSRDPVSEFVRWIGFDE
jgi:nitroreductase